MTAPAAWAQGSGPGFHASVSFGGGCPVSESQTVSSATPPALAGPQPVDCISGSALAAGEATATTLRTLSVSDYTCCGTATSSNGRARIQIDNVTIIGPPAASIPVSINVGVRGLILMDPDSGQAGVSVFVALRGFNSNLQSTSALDLNAAGVVNKTGLFESIPVGFPFTPISTAFVTPVANVAPNQPLRLDLELMSYSSLAGSGLTQADFFHQNFGLYLPFGAPVFNLPHGYTVHIPELDIFNNVVAPPSVVDGDFILVNTNVSEVSFPSVEAVTGSLNVAQNASATTIFFPDLTNVGQNLNVSEHANAVTIELGSLRAVGGNLNVSENASAVTIELPSLEDVGGNLNVSENASATTIELPSLDDVGGNLNVSENASATTIELPSLDDVGGNLNVSENASATTIDLGSLEVVGGDLTVANNATCTQVTLGALASVTGNLTVHSCGTGTFSLGSAAPGGNMDLLTAGYSALTGMTASGTTRISNATPDARLTVFLPANSFSTPTTFALTRVDPQTLGPGAGTGTDGGSATIDPIAAYQIQFGVPVLNADASLTFDVFLAGLDAGTAATLLQAVANNEATLVTRSDEPGSTFQAFRLCAGGETASPGGCVRVQLLDAQGQPATGAPAIVRFSGVAGHFSTWGVALVTAETSEPPTTFVFSGLLSPYPAPPHDETPAFARGKVIPIKFAWTDAAGLRVASSPAAPSVSVHAVSCAALAPSGDPITTDEGAESGGLIYKADTATWIFAWNTKPLAAGCYAITVSAGNPAFGSPTSSFAVRLENQ